MIFLEMLNIRAVNNNAATLKLKSDLYRLSGSITGVVPMSSANLGLQLPQTVEAPVQATSASTELLPCDNASVNSPRVTPVQLHILVLAGHCAIFSDSCSSQTSP